MHSAFLAANVSAYAFLCFIKWKPKLFPQWYKSHRLACGCHCLWCLWQCLWLWGVRPFTCQLGTCHPEYGSDGEKMSTVVVMMGHWSSDMFNLLPQCDLTVYGYWLWNYLYLVMFSPSSFSLLLFEEIHNKQFQFGFSSFLPIDEAMASRAVIGIFASYLSNWVGWAGAWAGIDLDTAKWLNDGKRPYVTMRSYCEPICGLLMGTVSDAQLCLTPPQTVCGSKNSLYHLSKFP